jgi:DNA primase large subunit
MGDPSQPGCPFRQLKEDQLRTFLNNNYGPLGLKPEDMGEIITMKNFDHYHVACTRVFEVTHGRKRGEGMGEGESVAHPNKYAQLGIEIEKEKQAAAEAMAID